MPFVWRLRLSRDRYSEKKSTYRTELLCQSVRVLWRLAPFVCFRSVEMTNWHQNCLRCESISFTFCAASNTKNWMEFWSRNAEDDNSRIEFISCQPFSFQNVNDVIATFNSFTERRPNRTEQECIEFWILSASSLENQTALLMSDSEASAGHDQWTYVLLVNVMGQEYRRQFVPFHRF